MLLTGILICSSLGFAGIIAATSPIHLETGMHDDRVALCAGLCSVRLIQEQEDAQEPGIATLSTAMAGWRPVNA